jgi:hypothetical protein
MLVYKDDGPHQRPGGTYDFKNVLEEELESALEQGFFKTMEGVITGKDPIITPTGKEVKTNAIKKGQEQKSNISKHSNGNTKR